MSSTTDENLAYVRKDALIFLTTSLGELLSEKEMVQTCC